jgi:hypothetical protein
MGGAYQIGNRARGTRFRRTLNANRCPPIFILGGAGTTGMGDWYYRAKSDARVVLRHHNWGFCSARCGSRDRLPGSGSQGVGLPPVSTIPSGLAVVRPCIWGWVWEGRGRQFPPLPSPAPTCPNTPPLWPARPGAVGSRTSDGLIRLTVLLGINQVHSFIM